MSTFIKALSSISSVPNSIWLNDTLPWNPSVTLKLSACINPFTVNVAISVNLCCHSVSIFSSDVKTSLVGDDPETL